MTVLGWENFDPEVVAGLRQGDPGYVDKRKGMRCPIEGHTYELSWVDGDYRRGTRPCDQSAVHFRVSPTYIYEKPLDNFIAGRDLISEVLAGKWKKAETKRLGRENSEDAVSWNFFRSIQEAGELRKVASFLGAETSDEPELFLWGRSVSLDSAHPSSSIQKVLDDLEDRHKQQTEPDVVLHIPGWGWIFIEAKFGSPTTTYTSRPEALRGWIERYVPKCPGLFQPEMASADPKSFPEQILRNIAVAHRIAASDEQAVVVALVRERDKKIDLEAWVRACVMTDVAPAFKRLSWEALYESLAPVKELEALRAYMQNKSLGLRKAFSIS